MSADFALQNGELALLVLRGVILNESDALAAVGIQDNSARVDILFDERRAHLRSAC